jgi:itaconate CoA-transferase
LHSIIVEIFAALSAEQIIARLGIAQIANARMNDMHEGWNHPQLRARARWSQIGTPAGMIPALLPPSTADYFTPRMDSVPALGQHTDSILTELGWRPADVERLRAGGAI